MKRRDCRQKIRVLVVDDHAIVRQAVQTFLNVQPDITVCGLSASVSEALKKTTELRPDVVLVDLRLGAESGLELIRRLRALGFAAGIVVLSSQEGRPYERAARTAGADGYVTKRAAPHVLIQSIRALDLTQSPTNHPVRSSARSSSTNHPKNLFVTACPA
jgi:DNA-binding NarL/FixJ family response regulator